MRDAKGRFIKGHRGYWLGLKRLTNCGAGRKKGFIVSDETRKKISLAQKGRKLSIITIEKMRRISLKNNFAKHLPKMSGNKHPNWKGGITSKNTKLRNNLDYKKWRREVLERDKYICQICKKRGGYLQVDHLKSFAKFPELRFDINNGRTLCFECHYLITWNKKFNGVSTKIYKFYPSLEG